MNLSEMTIGIIGGGTVGAATAKSLIEHVKEVRIYDTDPKKSNRRAVDALESDLVFICLPTPQKDGSSLECDISALDTFFDLKLFNLKPHLLDGNFVLKSTVPIGTTRMLRDKYHLPNLVHSPEFLTARCAATDAHCPTRNIIGVPGGWFKAGGCGDLLETFLAQRFPGVQTLKMSSDESEAVKLFQNGFFATKIAYFNEVRTLADKLGLDWEAVMGGILADGRIAHSHTKVPGHDGLRGFGGKCLRKDLASLINCFSSAGLMAPVALAAYIRNKEIDRKEE